MKRIVGYRIIASNFADKLETLVMLHMEDGWQPFGSLQMGEKVTVANYNQAMVMYEENND